MSFSRFHGVGYSTLIAGREAEGFFMKLVEGNVKSYDPNTCRLEVEVDRNGSRVVVMTKEPLSFMPDERIRFQMVEDRWGPCACNIEHLN